MINLLPATDRQALRSEYRHRLFIVGGLLTFGLTIIILIIISSFAFVLSLRRDEVLGQINASRQGFSMDKLTTIQQAIKEANSLIKILAVIPSQESISAVYRRLIDKRGVGIQLTHFKFLGEGSGRVEISGRGVTRTDLLSYIDTLKTDTHFQSVESPVKNIIRERDITFNLTVTLAPYK